jgi:hypothetical protein
MKAEQDRRGRVAASRNAAARFAACLLVAGVLALIVRTAWISSAVPEGALSDRQMIAVLAFIKNRWPIGVRLYQSLLNPDRQGMPSVTAETDWTFPIDCGYEPTRASAAAK